mgnify:CR=1 FL=1
MPITTPSLEELLKSGAHFGHLTRRWNPKMEDFIFMQRNGIHIIDLKKSQKFFQEALDNLRKMARAGKNILFVGTKKQAQDIVKSEAIRCGMPYVTHRWLGGMLTNFTTVKKSISRMEEIEKMRKDGTFDELTKKETLMLEREHDKLEQTLGGISNMNRLPGAIFVVDTNKEHLAVNEAIKLRIPIVAMVDSNSDPDIPDYIIPCNDDSARTIQLITQYVTDAIIEGTAERESQNEEELLREAAKEAKKAEEGQKEESKDAPKAKKSRRKRRRKKKTDSKTKKEIREQVKSGSADSDDEQKEDDAKSESKDNKKKEASKEAEAEAASAKEDENDDAEKTAKEDES